MSTISLAVPLDGVEELPPPPNLSRAARRSERHFRQQATKRRYRQLAVNKAVRVYIMVTKKGHKPRPKRVTTTIRPARSRHQRAWGTVTRREVLDELVRETPLDVFVSDESLLDDAPAVISGRDGLSEDIDPEIVEIAEMFVEPDGLPPGCHFMTKAELEGRLAYEL